MRTIILIQAIIIVLGAYYLYTLTHVTKVEQSPAPVVEMVPASTTSTIHPGYVPPTTQPPKDDVSSSATSTVKGATDVGGMEYPNPDSNYTDQPLR